MNVVNAVSKTEIEMVHALLLKNYSAVYADVWKIGVNMSLRISDLLALRYADLDLTNRTAVLIERKTCKIKHIRLNKTVIDIVKRRRKENPYQVWLFQLDSHKSRGKPVTRVTISRALKETGDLLGLTIATHSMRKARGMAMYKDGVPIEKIARVLNHSNTASTLRYLGITQEEVLQTYDEYEL